MSTSLQLLFILLLPNINLIIADKILELLSHLNYLYLLSINFHLDLHTCCDLLKLLCSRNCHDVIVVILICLNTFELIVNRQTNKRGGRLSFIRIGPFVILDNTLLIYSKKLFVTKWSVYSQLFGTLSLKIRKRYFKETLFLNLFSN